MFPVVSLAADRAGAVPRPSPATRSLAGLLVGGFFLGIAGTAFAVGVPFVNAWFPPRAARPRHRRLRRRHGRHRDQRPDHGEARRRRTASRRRSCSPPSSWPSTPCVAVLVLRDAPGRVLPTEPLGRRLGADAAAADHLAGVGPVRRRVRRLRRVLGLPADVPQDRLRADPGRRGEPDGRASCWSPWSCGRSAAGCPTGSAPVPVLAAAFGGRGGRRRGRRRHPDLVPLGTIAFLSMAAALGAGAGATFALVAQRAPAARSAPSPAWSAPPAGSAASCPPLLMGSIYGQLRLATASAWPCWRWSPLPPGASPRRSCAGRSRRPRGALRPVVQRVTSSTDPAAADRDRRPGADALLRARPVLPPRRRGVRRPAASSSGPAAGRATSSTATGGATTRSSAPPTA